MLTEEEAIETVGQIEQAIKSIDKVAQELRDLRAEVIYRRKHSAFGEGCLLFIEGKLDEIIKQLVGE